MARERKIYTTSWWTLVLLIISAVAGAGYVLYTARGEAIIYDDIDAMLKRLDDSSYQKVTLPQSSRPLYIPSLSAFQSDGNWVYVAKSQPLPSTFAPHGLSPIELPFSSTDSQPLLRTHVVTQLKKLFAHAQTENYNLIVSSAYRSIDDQKKMYDDFVSKKGATLAKQYVADPGSSEHHTGLAVDINDDSSSCRSDSEKCSLSWSSAAWLADNAPTYGFIIRYPAGAQPITGIAYEPWHLRYVGVILAQQLSASDLTYDEFIEQVAPGRLGR